LKFENFMADVSPRPSPAHSLDRINNNGHYEPGNVRWATRQEQGRNTRRSLFLTFQGETLCVKDWSGRIGISVPAITRRLRCGLRIDQVLNSKRSHSRVANGQGFHSLKKRGALPSAQEAASLLEVEAETYGRAQIVRSAYNGKPSAI